MREVAGPPSPGVLALLVFLGLYLYQSILNIYFLVIPAYVPNFYHFVAVSLGLAAHRALFFPLLCTTIVLILLFILSVHSPLRAVYVCGENAAQLGLDYLSVIFVSLLCLYSGWYASRMAARRRKIADLPPALPTFSPLGSVAIVWIVMDLLLNALAALEHLPSIRVVDSPHFILFAALMGYTIVYASAEDVALEADAMKLAGERLPPRALGGGVSQVVAVREEEGEEEGARRSLHRQEENRHLLGAPQDEREDWASIVSITALLLVAIFGLAASGREWIQEISTSRLFRAGVAHTSLFYGCDTTLTADEWTVSLREPFVWYTFVMQVNDMLLLLTGLAVVLHLLYDLLFVRCFQR